LGGTTIKTAVVDGTGRIVHWTGVETGAAEGPEAVIGRICTSVRQVLEESKITTRDIRGIGLGTPGPLDTRTGVVLDAVNLPRWKNVPLVEIISKETGVAATLDNDANAAAWGEYWAGAGKEVRSMVMLTLGTGIGGGVVIEDRLLRGATDTAAELGHTTINFDGPLCNCGNHGCVEAYASSPNTVRRFKEALAAGSDSSLRDRVQQGEEITTKLMHEEALKGDALCRQTLEDTGRYLGIGITNFIHTVDPERVVLSGGMIAAGDMIMAPLREEMKKRTFPVPAERVQVVWATLGDFAGVIGAAGCLLSRLETSA